MALNILFICHRIPYPPNKGDKIRSYNILRHILRHHHVALACMLDDPRDGLHLGTLGSMVNSLFHDTFTPGQKRIKSLFPAMVKSLPVTVPYFYSGKVQQEIDAYLDTHDVDVVLCSSSPSAEYVFQSRHYAGKLRQARWIMDFIDMDSVKWRQYAERQGPIGRWIYRREARLLLEYEKRIAREFACSFIVSEPEKKTFLECIPGANLTAIRNGVDLEYFRPSHATSLERKGVNLVFTGAMDYWPNVEGATWFVEKVLPRIRVSCPDVRFFIVGSNPDPALLKLSGQNGVEVTGFIEDIRDYLALADLCIIPLFIARGIQNKVLEAMAMGKPVVCTPQAAEGILSARGEELILAEDDNAFTQAILSLLGNKAQAARIGQTARAYVEQAFSWEKNLPQLDTLLSGGVFRP